MTQAVKRFSGRAAVLALAGLLIGFGWFELSPGAKLFPGPDSGARFARELIWFALGGFMLFWVLRVERLPLPSVGLRRPDRRTWAWAAAATVAMMATVMLSFALILPALGLPMNQGAMATVSGGPIWLPVLTALRAGIVEEIVFRGYAIERIAALTGSKWAAALIPAVIFIAGHLAFWGPGQVIIVAFGALILTALYLWRRDLVCNITAHVAVDLIGFMLARAQI